MEPDASGFVLFHVDGDRIWKERDSCEHEEKFEQEIRLGVEQVLMDRGVPQADREAALSRLVLVMPFWCIEAWCYQNTHVAIRLCHEQYSGADVPLFESWTGDRSLLDEVPKPKTAVRLGGKYNKRLASEAYPADDVYLAGKSFAAAIDRLHAVKDLRRALARTYM